ncbi:MAG: radical SAM protein [Desulfobacterales bacterium]
MTGALVRLTGQLIRNGIRFRLLRVSGRMGTLRAVSLEITHRCIARCRMCNIWRIPRESPQLSVEAWLALLSEDVFSDLVEVDITGGEPFLREDLTELLTGICRLKPRLLSSLNTIAVTTNGFLTRRVLAETRQILTEAQRAGVTLVMVCAMDAVGDQHDIVRNVPGGWQKVDRTLQGLVRLRASFPNLIIGLKTTVLPDTIGHLDGIVRYAEKKDLFTIISPCIVTKGRYLNADLADELTFQPKHVREMTRFFQKSVSRWAFHERGLVRYFRSGRMKKPCSCGYNYCFIRSDGSLLLCPITDTSPGNVTETPVEALLASEEAGRIRRHVGRFPECRHCTEPGLERYSLPYEGWTYLAMLLMMGRKRFLKMHHHMGLDKYFT